MIDNYTEEEILKSIQQRERTRENQRRWKENNPDKVKEYSKKHYIPVKDKTEEELEEYRIRSDKQKEKARQKRINNKQKYLLDSATSRAKRNGIEIDRKSVV